AEVNTVLYQLPEEELSLIESIAAKTELFEQTNQPISFISALAENATIILGNFNNATNFLLKTPLINFTTSVNNLLSGENTPHTLTENMQLNTSAEINSFFVKQNQFSA